MPTVLDRTQSSAEDRNLRAENAELAPMEGVTDFAMRLWLWLSGQPQAMTTPFLRATASYPHRALPVEFAPELGMLAGAFPYRLTPQIMAADLDEFLRAATLAADISPVVELNCGCPAPTCSGKGAGSGLLRVPEVFTAFAAGASAGLGPGRLAIKMRTGYIDPREFPALLDAVTQLPLARLTVHGRTRSDRYLGQARWELIGAASTQLSVPVVGSGDILDRHGAAERQKLAPKAEALMIGRGALRNPWIFEELRQDRTITLPRTLIAPALASYALMVELFLEDPQPLLQWVADAPPAACGRDVDAWTRLAERLAARVHGPSADWRQATVSRRSLGRTKMLWNYWRSGLPNSFFAPRTLRQGSLPELLTAISALCDAQEEELPLLHQPAYDWLYAGGKGTNNSESCAPTAGDEEKAPTSAVLQEV